VFDLDVQDLLGLGSLQGEDPGINAIVSRGYALDSHNRIGRDPASEKFGEENTW